MKSIIVPVDFSKQSETALKVAAHIAEKNDAELVVLHMLELSDGIMSNADSIPEVHIVHLIKIAKQRFEQFLDRPYLKDISVTPIIKHYRVFSEVDEVAKKHEADLIVMGSHGVDGLEELFIGSNTERVVRNSDIPVLVVKKEGATPDIKRFVFACDFKIESVPAVKKAASFARLLGAKMQMVYINTPADAFLSTEDIEKRISKFMNIALLNHEVTIFNDYSVEKGVLNYAELNGADLIGIPTHGRKGLAHFFMGSIGEDIANHSAIPVVTFKI
ncbi:MAG: universal stress protein [Bacteroidota bacterium]